MTTTTEAPGRRMDERFRVRRQQIRRTRARKRRRLATGVALILAVLAGGVAVARSSLFAIEDVRVEGVDGARAAEAAAAAAIRPGENLLGADLEAAAARVMALPWVRTVEVGRLPPATVRVAVQPRTVVATVRTADASWMIDRSGVVVAGGADEGVVTIDAVNSVVPGPGERVSDEAIRNALAVHAELPPQLRRRVTHYDAASARGLRLLLRADAAPDGVWVRFGLAERIEAKAKVLSALLRQAGEHLSADGSSAGIAELDVRAPDNPVVVPAGS